MDASFREEFRYVISEYNYFEILKNGVSKGEALKFLKKYLNVPDDGGKDYLNDFYPAVLENSKSGGKVCSIPFQRSSIVLYYNKDAFKEASLETENAPKNWGSLRKMLKN